MKLKMMVASVFLILGLVACLPPTQEQLGIHAEINNYRASQGLGPVGLSMNLQSYAQDWANHMAATGALVHSDLWGLLDRYPALNSCGEIILVGPGWSTPKQMVDAWVGSPSHRAIMVGDYTMEGNATARDAIGRVWAVAEFCR